MATFGYPWLYLSTHVAARTGSTYGTASGFLVAALAGNLEGDIVWGVALDLDGTGREVVEVLVQQLRIVTLAIVA